MGNVAAQGFSAPAPLTSDHWLDAFQCAGPELERWLKQRALKNQLAGASRVFVVCADDAVVGYYALAAGSVRHAEAPGRIRRNMPEPIPVAILGRLAVHSAWGGRGIGGGLLKDAVERTLNLAEGMGIRILLCHAISERAKKFYQDRGFVPSPVGPLTVMLDLAPLARLR